MYIPSAYIIHHQRKNASHDESVHHKERFVVFSKGIFVVVEEIREAGRKRRCVCCSSIESALM